MHNFWFKFYLNGRPYEETVRAMDMSSAKKLIETRYPGCNIVNWKRMD